MNILDKIVARKREEVREAKQKVSLSELEQSVYFSQIVPSFKRRILAEGSTGIIAEFKRRSPSKGDINGNARVEDVLPGYEKAGVACASVLTDRDFFGGGDADLIQARELVKLPIIRKEFIIDPYQIYEAKSFGASAILLIGAILNASQTADLAAVANALGMEVLFEIHDEVELNQLNNHIQLVGINNRNLKTFKVDLEQSMRLAEMLPSEMVPVAESGIASISDYFMLKDAGFKGFLMGEYFMKQPNPAEACAAFCNLVRNEATTA